MHTNNKEIKHIIDEINNLTPWDRNEIISYIGTVMFDDDDVIEHAKSLGMIFEEEAYDIIENMDIDEVLDNFSDYEIVDYVSQHPSLIEDIAVEALSDNFENIMEKYIDSYKYTNTNEEKLKEWYKKKFKNV